MRYVFCFEDYFVLPPQEKSPLGTKSRHLYNGVVAQNASEPVCLELISGSTVKRVVSSVSRVSLFFFISATARRRRGQQSLCVTGQLRGWGRRGCVYIRASIQVERQCTLCSFSPVQTLPPPYNRLLALSSLYYPLRRRVTCVQYSGGSEERATRILQE